MVFIGGQEGATMAHQNGIRRGEMTAYDHWKTNAPERNDEAWSEAVEDVADGLSSGDQEEMVQILANATGALDWISGAVVMPHQHLAAFRDLIALADGYREKVDDSMKVYHDARD